MQAGGNKPYYCFKGTCSNCKCYSSVTHKEVSCYFYNFEDIFGTKLQNNIFDYPDKRIAVFPDSKQIKIQVGEEGSFTFAVQNIEENSTKKSFIYTLLVSNEEDQILEKCGKDKSYFLSLINLQTKGTFELSQGEEKVSIIKITSEESTPKCMIRYMITINEQENNEPYAGEEMDVLFE